MIILKGQLCCGAARALGGPCKVHLLKKWLHFLCRWSVGRMQWPYINSKAFHQPTSPALTPAHSTMQHHATCQKLYTVHPLHPRTMPTQAVLVHHPRPFADIKKTHVFSANKIFLIQFQFFSNLKQATTAWRWSFANRFDRNFTTGWRTRYGGHTGRRRAKGSVPF